MAPRPLILDVDTGVDDALALLYAVASPEVDVIGATCVMGNISVEQATENTLAVLEAAGRPEVEVAHGAGRPLARDHVPFPVVHGERGLGRATPPSASAAPSDRTAVEVLVGSARERPGEVLLVATGPLTNVALALREEPRLPELLGGFALMGGAFARGGNVTPAAEANIWVDPLAAAEVFTAFSGADDERLPICIGLDVTEGAVMRRPELDAVCAPAPDSPLGQLIEGATSFYLDFYAAVVGEDGCRLHDPLAVAVAIDPSLVRLETTRVEVETEGRWTMGQTVADLAGVRGSPWPVGWEPEANARVAFDLEPDAFMTRFVERVRSLVEARA
ncbi:MAG: nucleoside hydrolase [Actinomycetota bacterium]